MKAMVRLTLLGLALLLGPPSTATAEYLVESAGIRFPARLGSMDFLRGQAYPDPRLGHGIEYRARITSGMLAGSIYVYDAGRPAIPDGIANPIVRGEFDQACRDVTTVARQQGLPAPELISQRTIRNGAIEFLTATYKIVRNDVTSMSLVALTGVRRHFIKLRISVPEASGPLGVGVMDKFTDDVARLLQTRAEAIDLVAPSAVAVR